MTTIECVPAWVVTQREAATMTETGLHATAGPPERRGTGRGTQRFLADAGAVLAASLDHDETLISITRVIVPALADWCAVTLSPANAADRTWEVAHADAALETILREQDWTL
ncbi:MAG TPA: hypothetical protein VFV93_18665, partial [Thermomicrobiales bacterium]|nr:hypothetical protein [Thermomicrobiales bacterium]